MEIYDFSSPSFVWPSTSQPSILNNMNLKRLILLPLLFCLALPMWAGGGMWIPSLLETLNESEMQDLGMRMSAEDIYSVNQSSLKDAIVKFGRGCTGALQ